MSRQLAAATFAAALYLSGSALAAAKLGFVDLHRALDELEEGKAAKARLQAVLEAKQKEIDSEQEALRKEKEEIDRQAGAMSEETRLQRQNDLQRKVVDLAQKWERAKTEMNNKEQAELQAIFSKLDPIIQSIAERDGLTMVFEKNVFAFAASQLDYTNEVMRMYRAQHPQKAGDKSPVVDKGDATQKSTTPKAPKRASNK